MKMKELYKNNKERKFKPIERIENENIELKSSPLEVIKNNFWKFFLVVAVIFAILFIVFFGNWDAFGIICGFFAFMAIACIIINTYSLKCTSNSLQMGLNLFQKLDLPYDKIINIYVGKEMSSAGILYRMNYVLTVRYIDNLNFVKELSLPTAFLKADDIDKFLNNFILLEEENEECIKYEKYKAFKNIMKIAVFVLFVVVLGCVAFFSLK